MTVPTPQANDKSHKVRDAHIPSPCVRECCLNNNDICMGCSRSLNEILEWSSAPAERKLEIIANCRVRQLERKAL